MKVPPIPVPKEPAPPPSDNNSDSNGKEETEESKTIDAAGPGLDSAIVPAPIPAVIQASAVALLEDDDGGQDRVLTASRKEPLETAVSHEGKDGDGEEGEGGMVATSVDVTETVPVEAPPPPPEMPPEVGRGYTTPSNAPDIAPSQPTLSTFPINPPSRPIFSTHPLNPSSQLSLLLTTGASPCHQTLGDPEARQRNHGQKHAHIHHQTGATGDTMGRPQ